MKPLYRYPGGKTRLLTKIRDRLPKFVWYIEPFFGGGAVYFDQMPRNALVNDTNRDVMEFLGYVRHQWDIFGDVLQLYVTMWERLQKKTVMREQDLSDFYYSIRRNYNSLKLADVYNEQRAVYWWFLQELSFGGMFRYNKKGEFNIPYGKYHDKNLRKKYNEIEKFSKQSSNFIINMKDFRELFNYEYMFPFSKSFIFFDPPYPTEFNDYGNGRFTLDDWEDLSNHCRILHWKKAKFMVISNYNPVIEELFSEYNIEYVKGKYSFNIKNRNKRDVGYMIITNYEVEK